MGAVEGVLSFFELLLILLLVAFISYAIILNRRLGSIRESKSELEKVVNAFTEATSRADRSLKSLRMTADQTGRSLQHNIIKAQSLRDELSFLIERADRLAGKLENSIRSKRPAAPRGADKISQNTSNTEESVSLNQDRATLARSLADLSARMGEKNLSSPISSEQESVKNHPSKVEKDLVRALKRN